MAFEFREVSKPAMTIRPPTLRCCIWSNAAGNTTYKREELSSFHFESRDAV